jgi:hypothetical protein
MERIMELSQTQPQDGQVAESTPAQPQPVQSTQPPATPDPVVPQEPVAEPTPQEAGREQIYQKYYDTTQVPQDPPAGTEGGEQPLQASPPASTIPEEVPVPPTDNLSAQLDEIKTMLAQQEAAPLIDPEPQPDPEPVSPQPGDEEWIELYKQGKTEEGARALAKIVQKYGSAQENPAVERQQTLMETVQFLEAKSTMTNAAAEAERAHPELKEMEPYIKAAIDADMVKAQQDGLVKSYSDYANIYVKALTNHVNSASKIAQSIRATGAESAAVRSSEVVSSTVITPQQVSPFGESQSAPAPEGPQDPLQSYLKQRSAQQLRRDGMTLE